MHIIIIQQFKKNLRIESLAKNFKAWFSILYYKNLYQILLFLLII